MNKYPYYFEMYSTGLVINSGRHYVLAENIEKAIEIFKNSFSGAYISSYGKMSDDPITLDEFVEKLNAWKDKETEFRL